jgi:acyl-CoA synthetase (AMP-forming)/AMP-acid ligase II
VSEVAVIGVPDEKWGEVPVAAVVLMPDGTLDPQELITWTNKRVDAKFQRIRDVIIMTSFPRNVAGKMLKREMRDAYKRSDNKTP